MNTTTFKPQIRRGRTEIEVPYNEDSITFVYEKHGPNTYANVQGSIEQADLRPATMAETVSLIHPMYCGELKDTKEAEELRTLIKNKWLWAFTGNLYIPGKGVYIQDHPEVKDEMPFMDESELVRKLEASDSDVRFVPFGFETNRMTSQQLALNPYVMALAGQEGATKLGEIASTFGYKPYLWSFKDVDQPTIRGSALDSCLGLGRRLSVVGGDDFGYYRSGCAFGV